MHQSKKASLVLQDGKVYEGFSFGYEQSVAGEVVFNTAMSGYPESLTDPSYSGQILVFTYPLIGNYGVPVDEIKEGIARFYESEKIHVRGVVVSDYSFDYSHWNAVKSLAEWLQEQHIAGLYGVDTRAITRHLREYGSTAGKLLVEGQDVDWYDTNAVNQVDIVSCKEPITYGNGQKRVLMVDCGVKHNILRCLLRRDVTLIRVPWDYDFSTIPYDGLFISNGPGDPSQCGAAVEHIRQALSGDRPIFGICMGNQLLATAAGAKTYKLKYGHRGHNQPVRMIGTNKCFVTSQNHGFAVDDTLLGSDWEPLFVNMNDGTNEGIRHKSKPFFSCQFHPEAASGPTDTEFMFDEFIKLL